MDINVLKSIWEELNLNMQQKNTLRVAIEMYKDKHPEKEAKNAFHLYSCYNIYDMYTKNSDDDVKACMDMVLGRYNYDKDVVAMFNKLVKANKFILNDIRNNKMSLKTLRDTKASDLAVYTGAVGASKTQTGKSHLKDDSADVTITTESVLRQLQSETEMYIENIAFSMEQLKQMNVVKSPAYKDVCIDILMNVNNAIKCLELLVC